jgi:hypothetical protein
VSCRSGRKGKPVELASEEEWERERRTNESKENGKVATVPVRIPHDLLPKRLEGHRQRLVNRVLDLLERSGRKERLVRRSGGGRLSNLTDEPVDFAAHVGRDVEFERGGSGEEGVDGGSEGGTESDDFGGGTLRSGVLVVELLVLGEPKVEVPVSGKIISKEERSNTGAWRTHRFSADFSLNATKSSKSLSVRGGV